VRSFAREIEAANARAAFARELELEPPAETPVLPVTPDVVPSNDTARIEAAAKAAGEAEPVSDIIVPEVVVPLRPKISIFDQRQIPLKERGKRRWYYLSKAFAKYDGIGAPPPNDYRGSYRGRKAWGVCWHHTAVSGGFGARRNDVKRFLKRGVDKKYWLAIDIALEDPKTWARVMAIFKRYRGLPYHVLITHALVQCLNLPFDLVSWASNGANNRFMAVGWDANSYHDKLVDGSQEVLVLREHVRSIVSRARSEGHPIREFTTHAPYTNKPLDIGAQFIMYVLVPVALEFGDIYFRWDYRYIKRGSKKARTRSMRRVVEKAGFEVPAKLELPAKLAA